MARNAPSPSLQSYSKVTAITKSDSTVYNPPLDAFIPGTTANVAVLDAAGNTTTIAVIAGQEYRISCVKIMSTNTTATGIVGLNY